MARGATWIGAVHFTKGRERPVRKIVLHWMATNLAGCDATFTAGVREASAHYGLEDGTRHQYVHETDTAWHAGDRTINHESIGIEHSAQPGRDASEATVLDSIALCTDLCRDYGLTADAIHVHHEYYPTQCPGTLPVARIREAVRANLTNQEDDMPTAKEVADEVLNRPVKDSKGDTVTVGAAIGYILRNSTAAVVEGRAGRDALLEAVKAGQEAGPTADADAIVDALAARLTQE